ncbi:MAG: hypothetical protein AAF363_04280 [Bacteroidota bacterium]
MFSEKFGQAVEVWNYWGKYISVGAAAIGVLVLIIYGIRLASQKEYKDKYDFINRFEIKYLWSGLLFLIISGVVYSNTLVSESNVIWFLVRIFVSVMLGLIIGVVVQNILKFYYPFYVEKRLKKLRYTARVSPKSGKPMKLLSEEEEDVYLDEGMQAEEDAFSIDYDVWIDEETGYTKIEKYNGRLHALKCPECNYQTLKVTKEELMKAPTTDEEGELMKYYQCGYCGYKQRKTFNVAKLSEHAGPDKSTVPVES